ncbi:substrate binding domain-containing protein [Cypionkella sp.]|uniref:substrate binding domain-containing protein n=1 Tax=Cypionkella sp. TaxID=2811411 RepID=UPI002ABC7759|nr:substrate binding domain-containing protein [Cypionkella sp.]MDZ4392598.1 substrate binding domain-containing protein [Cypionkella sp.]
MSLTEEGSFLFDSAESLIKDFEQLDRSMRGRKKATNGTVTVSSPVEFGRKYVVPLIDSFSSQSPDVSFRLLFGDSDVNHVDCGCDVEIRFGALADCALTTRKLGEDSAITCAAPAYLEQFGAPQCPAQLADHNCLLFYDDRQAEDRWDYVVDDEAVVVRVVGNRLATDRRALVDIALAGKGLIRTSAWNIADQLAERTLIPVLESYRQAPTPIHLLTERRSLLPNRTIDFIDCTVSYFRRLNQRLSDVLAGPVETPVT